MIWCLVSTLFAVFCCRKIAEFVMFYPLTFAHAHSDVNKPWSESGIWFYYYSENGDHMNDCFEAWLNNFLFRISIWLGVGNKLQRPCLSADQPLDGARLARLFSQKIIWLKPNSDISTSTSSTNTRRVTDLYQVNFASLTF